MSIMRKIQKAVVPSFLGTTGKALDGLLTIASQAVHEWETNSQADATIRTAEHQLTQEERKLQLKIDTSSFKIEADKALLEMQLAEAQYAVQRLQAEFNVMVRTTAIMILQHPDKEAVLEAKLVAHKTNMEKALALVNKLSNITTEPETKEEFSFTPTFDFDLSDI